MKLRKLYILLLLVGLGLTRLIFFSRFIAEDKLVFDVRFLINYCVDFIFFYDMFVQMRTPYRDQLTGKLVLDVKEISYAYMTSWFPLDIMSVLPFELIQYAFPSSSSGGQDEGNLGELALLKFFRLTRLLKLLRVMRANRKLKQAQIGSGMRYFTLELIKVRLVKTNSILTFHLLLFLDNCLCNFFNPLVCMWISLGFRSSKPFRPDRLAKDI